MNDWLLRQPRIEQFLDLADASPHQLAARIEHPMLVLEILAETFQKQTGNLQTAAVATQDAGALSRRLAALRTVGKRVLSDGLVRLVFSVSKREGSPFRSRVTVGRTATSDVCLPDQQISKLHAYFEVDDERRYTLFDAGSRNRTMVNGVELVAKDPRRVASGDRVSFGPYAMLFLQPVDFQGYVARQIISIGPPSARGSGEGL